MTAVQPEPWLRALITTTTNNNNNHENVYLPMINIGSKIVL
jgi:hypothetical protein